MNRLLTSRNLSRSLLASEGKPLVELVELPRVYGVVKPGRKSNGRGFGLNRNERISLSSSSAKSSMCRGLSIAFAHSDNRMS